MDGGTTGLGVLKVSPHTNHIFITESVPPHTRENLKAQGYHFKTLTAPFEFAELEALCFPMENGT